METWGTQKQIYRRFSDDATIIGNFNVVGEDTLRISAHRMWYDYITGDSIDVSNVNMTIYLNPGEWRIFQIIT